MGDTGTGKSSLIRQLLEQIADRGEAAIVYDPALEFTPQFYEPDRGDQILNPLDTRMPYWSPGDEVQHKAEALAFAKSLFPDDRRDNRFFIEAPRRVFARLLSFKPTAADIAQWLQNPAEIDRRLAGTELASMIDASAPSQRAGVLASLSMVGEAFQLIPDRTETKGTWSAYEWAQHRKGWLFLTSTPQTLDRLRPLISVWFDLLLMRLLAGGSPVWIILDELPTLNKLPKLPEALAVARKPNVRLVIGLQGRAQLEARYDKEAEAMLSQPATKAFLRTSEPRAAEWISKSLGEIEFERLRESVNQDKMFAGYRRKSHNFSLDRQVKPLVLPSEIMGLKNLTGYLKSGNYIVRIRFEPNPVQPRQPAFVSRPIKNDDSPQKDKLDQLIASALQANDGQRLLESSNVSARGHADSAVEQIRTSTDAHDLASLEFGPGAAISRGGIHQPRAVGTMRRPRTSAESGKVGSRRTSGSRAMCAQRISPRCLKASIRAPESNWLSSGFRTSTKQPTARPSRRWATGRGGMRRSRRPRAFR